MPKWHGLDLGQEHPQVLKSIKKVHTSQISRLTPKSWIWSWTISDNGDHNIKILSSSGDLIHSIGCEGRGRGEFINPLGVAISNTGTIYAVSYNPDHVLQIF